MGAETTPSDSPSSTPAAGGSVASSPAPTPASPPLATAPAPAATSTPAAAPVSAPAPIPVAQRPITVGASEWCSRKSGSDKRVELLAAFYAEQLRTGHAHDTAANFDNRYAAFVSRAVA